MTGVSRRSFLKLSAGGAAAGVTGVSQFKQWVSPVAESREVPSGRDAFYATVCRECPAGCGLYGTYRDGRVYKAEGNPQHPLNRGSLCARGQASLQGQYDPDRLRQVQQGSSLGRGPPLSWSAAVSAIAGSLRGGGRAVMVSSLETGSLVEVMRTFTDPLGSGPGRLLLYEPFSYEPLKAAHEALFGLAVVPKYRLEACEFILSLAADFLEVWVSPVEFARQFATMHAFEDGRIGRMAYIGPRLSMTAGNADEFLQVEPDQICLVALAMLREMIDRGWTRKDLSPLEPRLSRLLADLPAPAGVTPARITQLARRFSQAKASAALAGPVGAAGPLATATAMAAGLLNYAAGSLGQAVDLTSPHALSNAADGRSLRQLLQALGPQDILFIHNANPAYNLPESVPLIRQAGMVVYMGAQASETARLAHWVLPTSYPLEAWGDYAPYPDVHGLIQPTMTQLYPDTWLPGDILLRIAREAGRPLARAGMSAPASSYRQWLAAYWQDLTGRRNGSEAPQGTELSPPSALSRQVQQRGGLFQALTAQAAPPPLQPRAVEALEAAMAGAAARPPRMQGASSPAAPEGEAPQGLQPRPQTAAASPPATAHAADLWCWGHILLFDGHLANRAWLQENPEPVTALTWGSWIEIHPDRAVALDLSEADVLELASAAGRIRAPVRITADIAPGAVAIGFGQGHTALGRVAAGVGANAWRLLGAGTAEGMFPRVTLRKTGESGRLAAVTHEQRQHQREILQWVRLSTLKTMRWGEGNPLILPLPEGYRPSRDIYPPHFYPEHRWAMVIDLQRCIGCQACAVACYAENNVAVVGPDNVQQGREMAWMQVQPFRAEQDHRRIGWIPMLCQHCDAAPCEAVCPVFAAVHNDEGLNAQIYNRCVGTRYCSNNCPYKVRRFNWFQPAWRPPLAWQLNPEVTVRCHGVMEKCTFCVQRIRKAEYRAKREGRKVREGEIVPACQQTCPTQAILFGDLMDARGEVARLTRHQPRRYHVLEELNTKPAITYLQRIDNDQ